MTRFQRSLQLWSLLVSASRERRTFTYGQLAGILDFRGAGVMGTFLGPIMFFCKKKGLPPLTVLVVNERTGLPGEGLATLEELNTDRESVFNFNWFSIEPPECRDFEAAVDG